MNDMKFPQAPCSLFFVTEAQRDEHQNTCNECIEIMSLFDEPEPTHPTSAGIEAALWALVGEIQITNTILEDLRGRDET